ncbi:Pr6Pr family membrane protein [Microbacterium sp.]|uniref:Pr6Pr family membrane protein n=1 Tax=Microbacterium sp. TaxID=51671 RepID=UPI0033423E65
MTSWWAPARLAAAALTAAAIIAQLIRTLERALHAPDSWAAHLPTVVANFFSFFTILSNVGAVVALALGGVWLLRHRHGAEPRWLSVLFACVATYMITTGIVYNILLRGIPLDQGSTVWWSNEVLHVVAPLFLLADVLFAPQRRRLPWSTLWIVVAFPIVWVVYTMLRAPLITAPATGAPSWYPYPFLDPANVGGYGGVSLYVVGIAVAILVVATGVLAVGRKRSVRPVVSAA